MAGWLFFACFLERRLVEITDREREDCRKGTRLREVFSLITLGVCCKYILFSPQRLYTGDSGDKDMYVVLLGGTVCAACYYDVPFVSLRPCFIFFVRALCMQ